ncbi:MAG: hypothetical protein ACYDBV_04545 [Nitrospiria bacterium]
MKRSGLFLFIILISFVFSNEAILAKEDVIAEILELSGTSKDIEGIPGDIRSTLVNIESQNKNLSAEDFKKVSKNIVNSFQVKEIYQKVYHRLSANFDPQMSSALLTILKDPLVRKMTRLELASSQPGFPKELEKFGLDLKSNPPDPARLTLVLRLDRELNAEEKMVDVQMAVYKGIFNVFNSVNPKDKKLSQSQMDEVFDRMGKGFEKNAKNFIEMLYLYIYRNASDQELARYINLSDTEEVKRFNQLVNGGIVEAITEAGEKALKSVSQTSTVKSSIDLPSRTRFFAREASRRS